MILHDHPAGAVQCRTHRSQLNKYLGTILTVFHHPLHLFQMTDGTGQTVNHRFLILMDMPMGVGNSVGVKIGMILSAFRLMFAYTGLFLNLLFHCDALLFCI